jgi:hypothetical protein
MIRIVALTEKFKIAWIMPEKQEGPLILTLRLDAASQAFFNAQRKLYFPPERNFLDAHLTLFHQLPNEQATFDYFAKLNLSPFDLNVTGLMNLGAGVAYRLESTELVKLHKQFSLQFSSVLIPQDRQGFRPHISVQNKTTPDVAKKLFTELSKTFTAFTGKAAGLDLWVYEGGPWRHAYSKTL